MPSHSTPTAKVLFLRTTVYQSHAITVLFKLLITVVLIPIHLSCVSSNKFSAISCSTTFQRQNALIKKYS